ncbi:MAG: hypothetical protein Q9211_006075 [Gyalolechia sp. 1 TL-2023]
MSSVGGVERSQVSVIERTHAVDKVRVRGCDLEGCDAMPDEDGVQLQDDDAQEAAEAVFCRRENGNSLDGVAASLDPYYVSGWRGLIRHQMKRVECL